MDATEFFAQCFVSLAGAAIVGAVVDARARRRDAQLRLYVAGVGAQWAGAAQRVDAAIKAMADGERPTPVSMPPPPTLQ